MNYKIILISILILPITYSCQRSNEKKQLETTISTDSIWSFKLPEIPAMLTSPEQKLDFMVRHYWDNLNIADTSYIQAKEELEQVWANYCGLLNRISLTTAQSVIKLTMENMSKNKKALVCFSDLADKYLYDPNSPMRNEELYIPILEVMVNTPTLNDIEKIRPIARLKLAQKNRPGTKALNFTYTLKSGKQGTLYQITSDYTILFLNNPGCHACSETITQLKSDQLINQLIAEKKLTALAVYPDEDLEAWEQHTNDFSKEWINGYDKIQAISQKELYDLKAIPTLYLLDKNKNVLLKDAPLSQISDFINQTLAH